MKLTFMNGSLLAAGLLGIALITGCKDKPAETVAPATKVLAPVITNVPQKVQLKAAPGRNVVITDLKIQDANTPKPGTVQLNVPVQMLKAKPADKNVAPEPASNK